MARFRGGLVIGLPSGLIRSTELLLLLIYDFAPTVGPLVRLLPGLAGAMAHVVSSFLGTRKQLIARLSTGPRRIENAGQRP